MSSVIDFNILLDLKRKLFLVLSQSEFANTCTVYKTRIVLRVGSPEAYPEMRILKQMFSQGSSPRENLEGLREAGKKKKEGKSRKGVVSGKLLPRTAGA